MHAESTAIFMLGILLVLITPGPTNTLLAAAGLRQGVRRSLPLIGAELAGYLLSISVWGCFLLAAAKAFPWLASALRIASGGYIAWLAVRMWRAARPRADAGQPSITIGTLFVATVLNPKGLLFASTIFPASAFGSAYAYVFAMGKFAALLMPVALGWIAFGAGMGSGAVPWVDPVKVQRGASIVLGVFSLSLAWAAMH